MGRSVGHHHASRAFSRQSLAVIHLSGYTGGAESWAKEEANLVAAVFCCCVFSLSPGAYIAMHSGVQEREAMRRKLVVLFVAFASVFGGVACTGGVEVEEGAEEEKEEAKQEAQEVQEEEREAEEELKEAEQAAEEEEQQEEELKK
jgi:hypothetical protein